MKFSILVYVLLFITLSCDREDDNDSVVNCDYPILISDSRYQSADSDEPFNIQDISIADGCLIIEIQSSGCDGSTWTAELIDSEGIAKSFPVQRFLKIEFKNIEECDAVISRTFSYDLEDIELSEYSEIILYIDGFDAQISYVY
mgnify:CR=1 FL=1